MKAIKFKDCNFTYAKDQPQYLTLHCRKFMDGTIITCWKMSLRERLVSLFTGRVWLSVLTFNQPLQPLMMETSRPKDARYGKPIS